MFIFLSKFLPLFVYPLGLACVLIFLALLVSYKRKTSNILIVLALVILWLSSTTGFSNLLARSLELKYLPPTEIPTGEVLVVLGGGTEPASPPRTTVEINGAGDRVLYAAELYKQGKAPFILLSGGDIEWLSSGSTTPAQDMAALLVQMGVPESALWLENESVNTYENALYAKEFLDEQDIDQILLVTSAMHMPRAVALFEKQGFEVTPLPVDFSVTDSISASSSEGNIISKLIDIMPTASNLALTTNAMKEYLGYFIYKLQGWL
jgi:uncharacterized SAM-binding protein YcdF (DUF218 family)